MISRTALTRGTQLAISRQSCTKVAQRRTFAAAASGGSFESTDVAGVKVASKESHGPTTRLAVVAKAGTRYEPLPGLTVGLEEFAFKNTQRRSGLRIVRESELLGGQLKAYHTREALVLQAEFLRQDLPYFTELLAEVISQTKYTTYEYHEEVSRVISLKQNKLSALSLALDSAHTSAFHTGLGSPLYPGGTTPIGVYVNENSVANYAQAAYTKSNIAVVADGATQAGLAKWVEPFFKSVPSSSSGSLALNTTPAKYRGGEQRTSFVGPSAYVIAFPGASASESKPEIAVLAALLGGESGISWSTGFTLLAKAAATAPHARAHASNLAYSDAGLFTIQITGPATSVKKVAEEAVQGLKAVASGSVSKEDLTKAIAKARFDILSSSELSGNGIVSAGTNLVQGGKTPQVAETVKALESVTAEKLKTAAKTLLDGKASVAAVGDLHVLPFAEDLGLKV
ncbi:hypothetical protein VTK73DRAFT_1167 [Phialemonium thermophilum]|uniref:Cytochrome b-c1 complex subunit 2, mitochondrial n=1 Tax=Phialemonium thermophilum TaxID=223376 RepID=A0ABR3XAV7_9PEZI